MCLTARLRLKKTFWLSPQRYLVIRQLDEGGKLLRTKDLSVQQIAIDLYLGYNSQYEFSSQFKHHFKMSQKIYSLEAGKQAEKR